MSSFISKTIKLKFLHQIMDLYEQIVRERAAKGPDYRNGLLDLERARNYQVDNINQNYSKWILL